MHVIQIIVLCSYSINKNAFIVLLQIKQKYLISNGYTQLELLRLLYQVGNTSSRKITEDKQLGPRLAVGE